MPTWTDVPHASVVNLDGSDPNKFPKAVPRLVVYRVGQSDKWGTYCIENNEAIPEMSPHWESRDRAKAEIVKYARSNLPEQWSKVVEQIN